MLVGVQVGLDAQDDAGRLGLGGDALQPPGDLLPQFGTILDVAVAEEGQEHHLLVEFGHHVDAIGDPLFGAGVRGVRHLVENPHGERSDFHAVVFCLGEILLAILRQAQIELLARLAEGDFDAVEADFLGRFERRGVTAFLDRPIAGSDLELSPPVGGEGAEGGRGEYATPDGGQGAAASDWARIHRRSPIRDCCLVLYQAVGGRAWPAESPRCNYIRLREAESRAGSEGARQGRIGKNHLKRYNSLRWLQQRKAAGLS